MSASITSFACSRVLCFDVSAENNQIALPYILAYKSQNLRPNLDQKVGRATYTRSRVIKKEIFTTRRTGRSAVALTGHR